MKEAETKRAPEISSWYGLYRSSLKSILTQDSIKHPAKVSWGLATRIYEHLVAEGWVRPGIDLVLDPMAGVGTFGVAAAHAGIRFLGIELEPRFVAIAAGNFERYRRAWTQFGMPQPLIIQGDARNLLALVGEADCVVSSPPYNLPMSQDHNGSRKGIRGTTPSEAGAFVKYGNTPGQIEGLPMGDLGMVVSSPPYADGCTHGHKLVDAHAEYIQGGHRGHVLESYGNTPGQLGEMPPGDVKAVLTSPPYGEAQTGGGLARIVERPHGSLTTCGYQGQGTTHGQCAAMPAKTYWSAVCNIYRQCYQLLPVGGHICLVVKAFVRGGVIVDLPGETAALLEHVGLRVLHEHRAMLTSQIGQMTLDGGEERKSRKSFFRRLAEKRGAPEINWEVVLCAVKE